MAGQGDHRNTLRGLSLLNIGAGQAVGDVEGHLEHGSWVLLQQFLEGFSGKLEEKAISFGFHCVGTVAVAKKSHLPHAFHGVNLAYTAASAPHSHATVGENVKRLSLLTFDKKSIASRNLDVSASPGHFFQRFLIEIAEKFRVSKKIDRFSHSGFFNTSVGFPSL